MKKWNVFVLFFICTQIKAQTQPTHNSTVGFEVDLLPYLSGGYYGSVWVGHNHMRFRAVITQITSPDFIVESGFTNNRIQAYTAIVDYFFRPNYEKWWIGSGFEYWKQSIQTDAQTSTAYFDNTIFTLGGGYVWKIYKNFYLNPWAGIHIRIGGPGNVPIDGEEYKVPELTPEISVKIGWHF